MPAIKTFRKRTKKTMGGHLFVSRHVQKNELKRILTMKPENNVEVCENKN